jgi:glyoxylase-like metal-dependent hydrolase (beta-lactamase superfamily II)
MKIFAAFLLTCAFSVVHASMAPVEETGVQPNARLATPPSPPPGFIPPPLHPRGVQLETRQLSNGVYALMSNTPFADNAGFIVGEDAVLVIDSHFNGEMGQQIIDAVRAVTDLPIRYLLNTNAFGDHVFGNHVFPDDTLIIAHQSTIDSLRISTVEGIAQTMRGTVNGDLSVFNGVELRLPDVGFDTVWAVDLGGRIVEMHWFGAGMSPHDSVVYLPNEKIAWTANLIFGAGTIPWARSGGIADYRATLSKMANTISPNTIVAGHGEIVGGEAVKNYLSYLDDILEQARQAALNDITGEAFSADASIDPKYAIEPTLEQLMTGFHRWNLQAAYRESQ